MRGCHDFAVGWYTARCVLIRLIFMTFVLLVFSDQIVASIKL